jgi:hypothetical protein
MGKFLLAFPAFIVAVFGVILVALGYSFGWTWPLGAAVVVAALGFLLDLLARKWLLYRHPVAAVWVMEAWALCPGAFAALAAAGVIVASVALKPGDSSTASAQTKEMLSAFLTAVTAFLTATFLKAADDADETWIAPHVEHAFYDRYKPRVAGQPQRPNTYYFQPALSEVERWVYRANYREAEGWGFKSRHKRARGIKLALTTGDHPDPHQP